jgi:hypothetical protein
MNSATRKILAAVAVALGGIFLLDNLPGLLQPPRVKCPLLVWLRPISHDPIAAWDYLDLKLLPGLSPWQPFEIRIQADGKVERTSKVCPLNPADSRTEIDPARARELLAFARDQGFCRLCSLYRPPSNVTVFDAGASRITLSTAGQVKSVSNSAGSPPKFFYELERRAILLSGIEPLIDTAKYTAERKTFCEEYREKQPRTMGPPNFF